MAARLHTMQRIGGRAALYVGFSKVDRPAFYPSASSFARSAVRYLVSSFIARNMVFSSDALRMRVQSCSTLD